MSGQNFLITRRFRRILMFSLIGLFFVISPLILLYTAGFRYDFSQKIFKQTGSLSIDIEPTDAAVYLNDKLLAERIPVRLSNLAPDSYLVRLSKVGYQDWSKRIIIESKKTTYIKDITLFKIPEVSQILTDFGDKIKQFFPASSGKYLLFLVANNDDSQELYLYDTQKKSSQLVISYKDNNFLEINWSPYADFFYIKDNPKQIQIFNANNLALTKKFTYEYPIGPVYWTKNNFQPELYLEVGKMVAIKKINSNGETSVKLTENNGISSWFFDDDGRLVVFREKTKTIIVGDNTFNVFDNIKSIIDGNRQRLIFQTDNETKILFLDDKIVGKTASISALNLYYNSNTKEWLCWSPWELWTIYENGNTQLLNRTGEEMHGLTSLDNFGVLMLIGKTKIMAFNPGYYVSNEILNNVEIDSATADINARKIYFWGKVADKTGVFELDY